MLKINIQNIKIQNNLFFSYRNVFLFFYFFKKIITISYYNIYLNFLKFSFFKIKNKLKILNTDNVNTDNVFKEENDISADFVKLYSLLIYKKNNWNKEVLFCNNEHANKNISFFFEKYKLQEMFGNFNIKKNYQYCFYNYFFFNLFVFFNSNIGVKSKQLTKNFNKKLFYSNFKDLGKKIFSVFMFDYFKSNFNNLKNIYFISFLNNFLSKNILLDKHTRFGFFKQKKIFYFYNFMKKAKKLKKKKTTNVGRFLLKKKYIKSRFSQFLYNYRNYGNYFNKNVQITIKTILDDEVFENNSFFSNLTLDYLDIFFLDFYFPNKIPALNKSRFNKIKGKKIYNKLKDLVVGFKKKKKYFFKYDYSFFIFRNVQKNKNTPILSINMCFELFTIYSLFSIYEFSRYMIFDFLYSNTLVNANFFKKCNTTENEINFYVFNKKTINTGFIFNNFLFFNFIKKFVFMRLYRQKKFFINKKINYLSSRLRNFYKNKFFKNDNIKQKKALFLMFNDNLVTDFKLKKEIRRYNSVKSFVDRVGANVKTFVTKKIKKYKNNIFFYTSRYFNIKIKNKLSNFRLGFLEKIKNIKLEKSIFLGSLKFSKKIYKDSFINKSKTNLSNFSRLVDFDKNKIINKYKYWYSFFNSWNWTFLFINNFYNFESKLDYHELRAQLMYQQNKTYHSNYFFIDNSKTFKDYRFIKEKDRDNFEYNPFFNKLKRKNILSKKVNSNVYYRDKVYKHKQDFYKRMRVLLVKNHHSKTLRRERLRVNYFFRLNYRFQHRLTNWLYYYKLNYGLNLYYNFNLTLENTLSNSKFIPDRLYIIFLLKKQLIYLNGYCIISPKTNLFRGDCISLKINWYVYVYLIYIKKIYKYNNIIIKSFLKTKYNKYKSDNPKNWNYVFQSSKDYDSPYYTEIDYMTLSCIVLFEPDYNYIIKKNFYNLTYVPLLSLFNLNWKYVV